MPQARHRFSGRTLRPVVAALVVVAAVAIGAAVLTATSGPGSSDDASRGGESTQSGAGELDETFELFDGAETSLGALGGRPAVVNFFASWCPPCEAEMPDFEAVHQERGGEVAFLGLALEDTRPEAEALAARTGVTYPLGDDPGGVLYRAFGAISMPATVFLDAEGSVVEVHGGVLTADQLRDRIDALIAEASR